MEMFQFDNFKNKLQTCKRILAKISETLPSLYGVLLICIYVTYSYVKYASDVPSKHTAFCTCLDEYCIYIFLYLLSTAYLAYILIYAKKNMIKQQEHEQTMIVPVDETNSRFAVRTGIIVFGIGTLAYTSLEIVHWIFRYTGGMSKEEEDMPYFVQFLLDDIIGFIFVLLQTSVIVKYHGLKIKEHAIFHRFGCMHVLSTNVILWVKTVIIESALAIDRLEESSTFELFCSKYDFKLKKQVNSYIYNGLVYTYSFVIEFSVIGAIVMLIIFLNIESNTNNVDPLARPNLNGNEIQHMKQSVANIDCSNSLQGMMWGASILFVAILSLILFCLIKYEVISPSQAWICENLTSLAFNSTGIFGCIFGIMKIQILKDEPRVRNLNTKRSSFDADTALLRFSACFLIIYAVFTCLNGCLLCFDESSVESGHGPLQIALGAIEIVQVTLQLQFLTELKHKVLPVEMREIMPGRQHVIFLFFLNFSQWIILTFETQKVIRTSTELGLYGLQGWIIIRRLTIPLAIFYRLHSAIISVELWQEVYNRNKDEQGDDRSNTHGVQEVLALDDES